MALEKFAYSKTFLATVTAHWKTGAPPPDVLLSAAVQVNRFQQGMCVWWRLHLSVSAASHHRQLADAAAAAVSEAEAAAESVRGRGSC